MRGRYLYIAISIPISEKNKTLKYLSRLTSSMRNDTMTSAPASASLLPTSEHVVVGSNATTTPNTNTTTPTTDGMNSKTSSDEISDQEKDDKFKLLEREIQEEHANYRKLIQQQQKQYEER